MKRLLFILSLFLLIMSGIVALAGANRQATLHQEELSRPRIYAYHGWQSVGVYVKRGDRLDIRAEGVWSYTPGEYHGPGGHPRFTSPSFYPLPGVPGGILIGRIGEQGEPFPVSIHFDMHSAGREGLLYLRIDDDILSDNDGWVAVDVNVISSGNMP
jgi:hypothetical protein